ncbi:MAG: DoxX family protein [Pseudomonadota bacterium]|jgi:putative oxidoreductase
MLASIDSILTPSERIAQWAELIFRIATSFIFIIGGLGHFGRHQMMLDRMADSPWRDTVNAIGDPSLLLWLSGAAFVVFGIALALGFMTRLSALVILLTLLPITFFTHIAPGHTGPLFKNIAIMGALILLTAKGGGAFSIDNRNP